MITKEMAKQAAEQGLIPALKCSRDKWQWPVDASRGEVIDAIGRSEFVSSGGNCALCQMFGMESGSNEDCPLFIKRNFGFCSCCSEWQTADKAIKDFEHNPTNLRFEIFQTACRAMVKRLDAEIEKAEQAEEQAKCNAKCKPLKARFGDKVIARAHGRRIRIALFDKDGHLRAYSKDRLPQGRASDSQYETIPNSNIFDDLTALGEDLKEWTSEEGDINHYCMTMCVMPTNKVFLGTECYGASYTLDQAQEIHRKLGQVIATARRNNQKSK